MYMRLQRQGELDAKPGSPITFVAVTPGRKRDNIDTADLPWTVENYRKVPVVLWSHDFGGRRLPIGRADVSVVDTAEGETINAAVTFDIDDDFAREVDRKYRNGFLFAVSASWEDVDADGIPARVTGSEAVAHDLLDISAVPIPADPDALEERQTRGLEALRAEIDAVLADGDDAELDCYVPDVTRDVDSDAAALSEGADGSDDVESEGEDEPKEADDERTADPNGAMPTGSDYDALVRGGAAGAMLAVFDPATEWSDAERRERYNWACVLYRWLGLEAPEFVERAELDALDTEAIRALFLAGEERIGKELSARNIKRLNEIRADVVRAGEGLTDLLARVTGDGEEDAERGDVYADVLRGLSNIGD